MACCPDLWWCDGKGSVYSAPVGDRPSWAVTGPWRTQELAIMGCPPIPEPDGPPYTGTAGCDPNWVYEWPRTVIGRFTDLAGYFSPLVGTAVIALPPPPIMLNVPTGVGSVVQNFEGGFRLVAGTLHWAVTSPRPRLEFFLQFAMQCFFNGFWTPHSVLTGSSIVLPWTTGSVSMGNMYPVECSTQPSFTGTVGSYAMNGTTIGPCDTIASGSFTFGFA